MCGVETVAEVTRALATQEERSRARGEEENDSSGEGERMIAQGRERE